MTEPAEPLGRFPVAIEIPVAWGDMDALGHVNNTVYLRWFESARIAYFDRLSLAASTGGTGVGPILARQAIDYRAPLTYPDRVRVETTVSRLGTTSFVMGFRITSVAKALLAAEGEGVGVLVRYATGEKVQLPDELRRAIHTLEGGAARRGP